MTGVQTVELARIGSVRAFGERLFPLARAASSQKIGHGHRK